MNISAQYKSAVLRLLVHPRANELLEKDIERHLMGKRSLAKKNNSGVLFSVPLAFTEISRLPIFFFGHPD